MTVLVSPFAGELSGPDADRLASVLKVLASPARLQILSLIHAAGESTVSALFPKVGLAQPTVMHHVAALVGAGLVNRDPQKPFVYLTVSRAGCMDLADVLDPRRLRGRRR